MNENLDLTKILEGCPEGTEFYHSGYGKVWFLDIDVSRTYPIRIRLNNTICDTAFVTSGGTINKEYDGECLLFPSKDQRDWSKFERFWDKLKIERFDVNTLQPFDKVLVRDEPDDYWTPNFFHSIMPDTDTIQCFTLSWSQCIPYNEETKHLLGTKNDCPEYYKWWEE